VRIFGEYSFLEDSRYTSQADSTVSCQWGDKRLLRNKYFGCGWNLVSERTQFHHRLFCRLFDQRSEYETILIGVLLRPPSLLVALGSWQGIYIAEHRARPHRREIVLQFIGSRQ
jgi:hypothetical protein